MTRMHIRLCALALLLFCNAPALAQTPGQARQDAPATAQREIRDQDEPLTERQMSLMEARILSRQGDYPKSLVLYERLRAAFPDDMEVYEDFLETLVANADYERTLFELVRFRKKFGSTSRSERIEAGLYSELGKPQYGLDILERAMRGNPNDTGLWSDVAVQRQSSRDINGAIQAFSSVLELDPDNQAAKDALHAMLLDRRPKTEVGFSLLDQGKKNLTSTWSTAWSMATGDNTRIFLAFDQIHFSRPDDVDGVEADLSTLGARIEHEYTRNVTLDFGLQSYLGMGGGLSPMVGARLNLEEFGLVGTSYTHHMPWYDQIDAVKLNGAKSRFHVEYELPFRRDWVAFAGYTWDTYSLAGKNDAGYSWEGTGSLSRRLWTRPDIFLTYTLQRSENQPAAGMPFAVVRRELSHAGTLSVTYPFFTWLEASVSGGIKRDTERGIESLQLAPRLTFRPVERLRLVLGWEHASQADTVAGGETNTYNAKFYWTW